MMNKIWCFMILTGLIVSSFNGKITTLSDTILSSSKEAVELCILMFGIVGLWSGLMNIALSLGITTQLQKLLTPFLTFLFPNLKNQKAKEYISTNIVANILGLGWAATPSGLKAMEELHTTEVSSKIADFKEIVTSFSELLTLENKALEEFDVETVSSLYERKAKTISAYRSLVAYFIKNQQELAALAEQERQEMKEISTRLDELIKTNEQLLKTRMETSKNVMDTIVNIAKVSNNINATSYGAQGRYSPLDNSKNALAVNRTL